MDILHTQLAEAMLPHKQAIPDQLVILHHARLEAAEHLRLFSLLPLVRHLEVADVVQVRQLQLLCHQLVKHLLIHRDLLMRQLQLVVMRGQLRLLIQVRFISSSFNNGLFILAPLPAAPLPPTPYNAPSAPQPSSYNPASSYGGQIPQAGQEEGNYEDQHVAPPAPNYGEQPTQIAPSSAPYGEENTAAPPPTDFNANEGKQNYDNIPASEATNQQVCLLSLFLCIILVNQA